MTRSTNLRQKLTLVILGRSGSGKGTQARFILRRLKRQGVRHFETGRFLREVLKKYRNPTIDLARKAMGSGKLFPDWFIAHILLREIIERGAADQHWVFDGAPRSLWQANLIEQVASWHARALPLAVHIAVGEKEARARLLRRARDDDRHRAIKNRLAFFAKKVLPVVRYYKSRGRLLAINGEQPVYNVRQDIDKALSRRLKTSWPKR